MLTETDAHIEGSARNIETTRTRTRRSSRIEPSVIAFAPNLGQRVYLPVRRFLEIAASLVLLTLSSPLLLLAAFGVKMTSAGPAFYSQARVGRGGRIFTIYKLRTMIDNCESLTGPRWCMPDDPRITWFGWILRRTHLDELPQLVNVLRGDMSLIGPRPERPEFVEELEKAIPGYPQRHDVLPGIGGLAQVHLPPDTDIDSVRRKLIYDLYYVRRFGPWLDLRLMACTALHALTIPFRIVVAVCLIPSKETIEKGRFASERESSDFSSKAAA